MRVSIEFCGFNTFRACTDCEYSTVCVYACVCVSLSHSLYHYHEGVSFERLDCISGLANTSVHF